MEQGACHAHRCAAKAGDARADAQFGRHMQFMPVVDGDAREDENLVAMGPARRHFHKQNRARIFEKLADGIVIGMAERIEIAEPHMVFDPVFIMFNVEMADVVHNRCNLCGKGNPF